VQNRNAALNLAVIRRAVVSVAVHWISRCKNPRRATMSGFYDFMSAANSKKAFKLLTRLRGFGWRFENLLGATV